MPREKSAQHRVPKVTRNGEKVLPGKPQIIPNGEDLRRPRNLDPYETCTGMAQTDIPPNLKETGFGKIRFLSSWLKSVFRPRLCSVYTRAETTPDGGPCPNVNKKDPRGPKKETPRNCQSIKVHKHGQRSSIPAAINTYLQIPPPRQSKSLGLVRFLSNLLHGRRLTM